MRTIKKKVRAFRLRRLSRLCRNKRMTIVCVIENSLQLSFRPCTKLANCVNILAFAFQQATHYTNSLILLSLSLGHHRHTISSQSLQIEPRLLMEKITRARDEKETHHPRREWEIWAALTIVTLCEGYKLHITWTRCCAYELRATNTRESDEIVFWEPHTSCYSWKTKLDENKV